jgi:hypothetical protein
MTPLQKYEAGRAALDSGDYERGIVLLKESARDQPHFKTYEIIGEAFLMNGRASEAVLYLAAASSLNRGVRATALLASALSKMRYPQQRLRLLEIQTTR